MCSARPCRRCARGHRQTRLPAQQQARGDGVSGAEARTRIVGGARVHPAPRWCGWTSADLICTPLVLCRLPPNALPFVLSSATLWGDRIGHALQACACVGPTVEVSVQGGATEASSAAAEAHDAVAEGGAASSATPALLACVTDWCDGWNRDGCGVWHALCAVTVAVCDSVWPPGGVPTGRPPPPPALTAACRVGACWAGGAGKALRAALHGPCAPAAPPALPSPHSLPAALDALRTLLVRAELDLDFALTSAPVHVRSAFNINSTQAIAVEPGECSPHPPACIPSGAALRALLPARR